MLIVLSGLPGVGKTTIARELARVLPAVHVRMDSIEQALRRIGLIVEGEGYAVAHAVAADNLYVGATVVADCVNPWPLRRKEWRRRGTGGCPRAGSRGRVLGRRRAPTPESSRGPRYPRSSGADLEEVVERDYRAWDRSLVIDTSRQTV